MILLTEEGGRTGSCFARFQVQIGALRFGAVGALRYSVEQSTDGVCSSNFMPPFQTAWYPNRGVPKNRYENANHTVPLGGNAPLNSVGDSCPSNSNLRQTN